MGLLDDHLSGADPESRGAALRHAATQREQEAEKQRRVTGWDAALEDIENALGSDLPRGAAALQRAQVPFDLSAECLRGVRVGLRRSGCWVLYREHGSGGGHDAHGSGGSPKPVLGMDAHGKIFWINPRGVIHKITYEASRRRDTGEPRWSNPPSPHDIAAGLADLLNRYDVAL